MSNPNKVQICPNCLSDQTECYDVVANDEDRSLYAARCFNCFYSWTVEVTDIDTDYLPRGEFE